MTDPLLPEESPGDDRLVPAGASDRPVATRLVAEERLLAGRYRVDELIGRGGMAEVHLGLDTRLNRRVAIKLLKSSLANDPTFRIRFRQEAQAAARMTHPTIVRVFDAGEETVLESGGGESQLPFIVMEFVDGKMLKDLIKDGPMTAAEAGHIVTGILTALEYSHRAGVVHRDIKPGNVMVTRTGQVKVMDFGIARAISDSSATVAQTTAILGTAQYFSPEQAKGETVDARSDLYSTGVVLFEMLTGHPPFSADTPVAVAYQHVSEAPERPGALNPQVSAAMDAVVARALAKDRGARYQTAAEFRSDLEMAVAGRTPTMRLPQVDKTVDLFGGADETPEATFRQLAIDDDSVRRTQSRPPVAWLWAGIVCVVVVVLAVAAWVASVATGGFGANMRTVPSNLVGATSTSAQAALKHLDLQPVVHNQSSTTVASGTVIRIDPTGGKTVDRGASVDLWVSTGPVRVAVPDVTNLTQDQAEQNLKAAGLTVGSVTPQDSPTVQKNTVISADPKAGTMLDKGAVVDLTVSTGQVLIQDYTGQPITDAENALKALGLTVPPPTGVGGCGAASDTVVQQDTPAGEVDQGSSVQLSYCDGT